MVKVVKVVAQRPIQPSPPYKLILFVIGILLVLHPVAWILLVNNQDQSRNELSGPLRMLLDTVQYLVSTVTPIAGNGFFSVFMAVFFFYYGSSQNMQRDEESMVAHP